MEGIGDVAPQKDCGLRSLDQINKRFYLKKVVYAESSSK